MSASAGCGPSESAIPRSNSVSKSFGTRTTARRHALVAPAGSVATLASAALCFVLGAATVARNRDYRDEVSLWTATVASSPNKSRPWNNLGYAYYVAGDNQAARRAYVKALEIEPEHVRARFNLRLIEP